MYYIDRNTLEYPLTRWDVLIRNPDFNDTGYWDDDVLEQLNVYPVYAKASDVEPRYDQTCVESTPREIDGKWYKSWIVVDLSPDELKEVYDQRWIQIRDLQQLILGQNVLISSTGNVSLEPQLSLDYKLPNGNNRIAISGGNVRYNGTLNGGVAVMDNVKLNTSSVSVNGQLIDMNTDQVIIADTVNILRVPSDSSAPLIQEEPWDNTDITPPLEPNSLPDTDPIESPQLVLHADDNVLIISPYPVEIVVSGIEVEPETYAAYLGSLRAITDADNPFEITWPQSPFRARAHRSDRDAI